MPPNLSRNSKRAVRLVSSGKGGAGKTTIMAAVIDHIAKKRQGMKVFVLDADPASTLPIALGLEAKPELGIGQLKDELARLSMEGDTKDKAAFVLRQMRQRAIQRVKIGDNDIDFAYMGHHQEDHCLCAYNNAVNETLTALIESDLYQYMVIDREAGVEHINRSVTQYSDPNNLMVVVTWPNASYMSVAKEAMDTYDALNASRNRLIVINNLNGKDFSRQDAVDMLSQYHLSAWPFIIFPPLKDIDEMTVGEAVENSPDVEAVLNTILGMMDSIRLSLITLHIYCEPDSTTGDNCKGDK